MVKIEKKITGFAVRENNHAPRPETTAKAVLSDSDRRLVLGRLPGIAEKSLRFPQRPKDRNGFTAWTSDFIQSPHGKFVLCISTAINGHHFPFEIWALGAEQPPAASLICQLLSKVFQTDDRGFIRHHIAALKKATEVPFDLTLPHSGDVVTARSVGAAIALVYEEHARHIGYLVDDADEQIDSPMLSAMSSIREPKSAGVGGFASFDDITNPSSGDDFPLFLKEVWMDGENQPIPISLWCGSKNVPIESEAILKLASLAMRHRDPAWIATLLKTMRKHHVVGQELGFASVGSNKQQYYNSTWAYVADLVLHRYVQLGILDEYGNPVAQRTLFAAPEITPISVASHQPHLQAASYHRCPECSGALMMSGGCEVCSCGYSRCG